MAKGSGKRPSNGEGTYMKKAGLNSVKETPIDGRQHLSEGSLTCLLINCDSFSEKHSCTLIFSMSSETYTNSLQAYLLGVTGKLLWFISFVYSFTKMGLCI